MDDALIRDSQQHFGATGADRGNGDSLLRKIDFKTDHFVATYGPNGEGLNKAQVAAPFAPSVSRRIEQIVSPLTPFFDTAIKTAGSFYGLGSAGQIDSYDSRKGHYVFCANNPSDPRYPDSREGSVQVGSATATIMGMLYGDLSTNGAKVTGKLGNITGTIDNNVPFSLNDYRMPATTAWTYVPPPLLGLPPGPGQLPSAVTGTTNLTPPARTGLPGTPVGGTADTPTYYEITTLSGTLTVNPTLDPITGQPVDTYVAIRVSGNVTGKINVKGGIPDPKNPDKATGNVKLKIYYDGNINVVARDIVNQSPTASNPFAGNLQFYGISPTDGSARTIDINPPVASVPLAATFYAPSADTHFNGNPDFIGTMVCKSFYGNGNVSWHYDRALNDDGELTGFRIVSYVEDIR
jgi:hypothetical protein